MNKVIRISILITHRHTIRNNEFRGLSSLSSRAFVFLRRERAFRVETRRCQRPARLFRAVCPLRFIAVGNVCPSSPVRHVRTRKCYSTTVFHRSFRINNITRPRGR